MPKLLVTCPLCGFRAFADRRFELDDWRFTGRGEAVCPACVKDQTPLATRPSALNAVQVHATYRYHQA